MQQTELTVLFDSDQRWLLGKAEACAARAGARPTKALFAVRSVQTQVMLSPEIIGRSMLGRTDKRDARSRPQPMGLLGATN